jgi:uncharacterized membrane protein YeaQ/YmgE (transglycosylase-associated protein family)
MLADSRQPRELPFLPTLVCLWAAGWASSLVTTFLFVGHAYPSTGSPADMLLLNFLLSVAVSTVVVRYLLASIAEVELSFSAILLALLAGSLASDLTQFVVFAEPVGLLTGLMLSLVPGIVGALVSFWLLTNAARTERPAAAAVETWEPTAPVEDEPYAPVVASAGETALGLVAEVESADQSAVPRVVADGLLGLEAAAARVERTPPPDDVPPELPRRLAAAMRQLADDLLAAQRSPWELDRSRGLHDVKEALAELDRLGYGTNWD